MKISIEDYEIVHTGVVIQMKNYPIRVTLTDDLEGDFTFIFNFLTNDEDKKLATNFNALDKHTISVDFINFDRQSNAGGLDPINVGTLGNVPLYLNYRITDLNNAGKTITFNFLTRKEVGNAK